MVTIKEIAHELGISSSAVSSVLNGNSGGTVRVSEEMQEKIRQVAREKGYVKKPYKKKAGLPQSSQKKPCIGVFFPNKEYSLERMIEDVEIFGPRKEYHVVLQPYQYGELEKDGELLSKEYYDGALIIGLRDAGLKYLESHDFEIPIVLLNRMSTKYTCLTGDLIELGIKIATLFIEQGHKNVGYISPPEMSMISTMRRAGFTDTFTNRTGKQPLVAEVEREDCTETIKDMLKKGVTAVYCDFTIVKPLLEVAEEMGIRIPEDLAVFSNGDEAFNAISRPSISCATVPIREMLDDGLQILINEIVKPTNIVFRKAYDAKLIFRDSFPEK